MKHLNKVIFVNSASMRYEEVELDGPVHMAGTSGAGKTTVLRGVLYFFTADQLHLGIDSNKENFNLYYFPMINSHIIYEFKKDDGTFCVILTKDSHNRVQYAFIDAPYSKDWIVDPVTGSAASVWSEVTKNIPQYIDRDLVINIKDYLKILWGCHPDKRYARYSMASCEGYSDILRSQKNVFLSSGFHASGFKSTIVRSLPGGSPMINLQQLRARMADYENEVRDMAVWQRISRCEDSEERKRSNIVLSNYYNYVESVKELKITLCQLQFALRKAGEDLPVMKSQREELSRQMEILREEIQLFEKKFEEYGNDIAGKIAVKEDKLKEVRRLKEKYKDIEAVRGEITDLPVFKESCEALKEDLTRLRSQNLDIENKYKQIELGLIESHQKIIAIINDAVRERCDTDNEKKKELSENRDSLTKKVEDTYGEKNKDLNTQIKGLQEKEKEKIREQASLEATNLYSDEIKAIENRVSELKGKIASLSMKVSVKKDECSRKEAEAVEKENEIWKRYKNAESEANQKKGKLSADLQKIESVLSRYDDTLYAWLEENKGGWQDTIGKVIDESVLYRTDLHPTLVIDDNDDSMYGVKLSAAGIPVRPFTPADYKKKLDKIQNEIASIDQALRDKAIERDRLTKENEDFYSKILRGIREEIAKHELQEKIDNTNILKAEKEIKELKEKAEREKLQKLKKITADLDGIRSGITECNSLIEHLRQEKNSKLESINSDYKDEVDKIDSLFGSFKEEQTAKKESEIQKYNSQVSSYAKQKQEELSGNGVDVSKIVAIEKDIKDYETKIRALEKKVLIVHDYDNDYDEKIKYEEEWSLELQDLKSVFERHQREGKEEKKRKEDEMSKIDKENARLKNLIESTEAALEEYNKQKRLFAYIASEKHIVEQETDRTLAELLELYKDFRQNKIDYMSELKKSVNHFKLYFKTNLFNLQADFETEEDYIKYARGLGEVISLNTIKVFCEGMKDNYIRTLQGIRMSMDGLVTAREQAKGIINDIDREFGNARLPEVIQEIRVRYADMKDDLYDCLNSIKDFMKVNEGVLPGVDLWTSQTEFDTVRDKMMEILATFVKTITNSSNKDRDIFSLEDMFQIEFKVTENGNTSGWETGVSSVIGSTGTDMMIKLMLNIMLISKSIKKNLKDKDLFFHCILDESEKVHATYMRNINDFCTERGIYLLLGSPMTNDPHAFKHNYELYKDDKHHTHVELLVGREDL